MKGSYYSLPADLPENIDAFENDVLSYLAGDMPANIMKAKRVPRGIYEQRQDDTFMMRVRVAGGVLGLDQIKELADIGREYGNGVLHVTTRQDVQFHDIALADTPAIMRRLMDAGLSSLGGGGNTVRNIAACPYAGVCPHECFDVTPCAQALTEYMISLKGSYNLPRKYKIAFSGCSSDCALAKVTDLGFIAETRAGSTGFRVFAGGGMGSKSRIADQLIDWIPVADIIRTAESVRRLFDRFGDRDNKHRARLRHVFERMGTADFRRHFMREMELVAREDVPEYLDTPRLNNVRIPECETPLEMSIVDGIRCFRQRQPSFVALPLRLKLGFISAADFGALAHLVDKFSTEKGLRTTRYQGLIIRFVEEKDLSALTREVQNIGEGLLEPSPLHRFVACAGASTCRLGLCLSRSAAESCATQLEKSEVNTNTIERLQIHINGCSNACGHQPVAPIGFYGVAKRFEGRLLPCYRVSLGGDCSTKGARFGKEVGQVPAKAIPELLIDIARDYENSGESDETFNCYFDRQGRQHFESIANRYTKIPAYSDKPDYYRDFGVDQEFSLAGRGAGECGAGVFDVIQADLNAARKGVANWEKLEPAARALLITRGVDARDPDTVLREFEKHFIDTRLVPESYRDLIARARGLARGWSEALDGYGDVVESFIDQIERLYATLDASLEFHPAKKNESDKNIDENPDDQCIPHSGSQKFVKLDLSGVPCPLNFVKAKLQLECMQVGDRLDIILDEGEPIENVPGSFISEGQTIEDTVDLRDGHWRVLVKKEK